MSVRADSNVANLCWALKWVAFLNFCRVVYSFERMRGLVVISEAGIKIWARTVNEESDRMWATLLLFWAVKDRGWSGVCAEYNYQGARLIFDCIKENDQVIVRFLDWNVHYHAGPWSELTHLQEEVWRKLTWWRNENSKVGLKSVENSAPKSDLLQVCTYFWNKEKNSKIFFFESEAILSALLPLIGYRLREIDWEGFHSTKPHGSLSNVNFEGVHILLKRTV